MKVASTLGAQARGKSRSYSAELQMRQASIPRERGFEPIENLKANVKWLSAAELGTHLKEVGLCMG